MTEQERKAKKYPNAKKEQKGNVGREETNIRQNANEKNYRTANVSFFNIRKNNRSFV